MKLKSVQVCNPVDLWEYVDISGHRNDGNLMKYC